MAGTSAFQPLPLPSSDSDEQLGGLAGAVRAGREPGVLQVRAGLPLLLPVVLLGALVPMSGTPTACFLDTTHVASQTRRLLSFVTSEVLETAEQLTDLLGEVRRVCRG